MLEVLGRRKSGRKQKKRKKESEREGVRERERDKRKGKKENYIQISGYERLNKAVKH